MKAAHPLTVSRNMGVFENERTDSGNAHRTALARRIGEHARGGAGFGTYGAH